MFCSESQINHHSESEDEKSKQTQRTQRAAVRRGRPGWELGMAADGPGSLGISDSSKGKRRRSVCLVPPENTRRQPVVCPGLLVLYGRVKFVYLSLEKVEVGQAKTRPTQTGDPTLALEKDSWTRDTFLGVQGLSTHQHSWHHFFLQPFCPPHSWCRLRLCQLCSLV